MGKMTRRMAAGAAALAVAFAVLACLVPQAAYAKRVPVRSKISAYSWTELKGIADRISKAKTDKAGLKIAKKYHLVSSKGKLKGQTKKMKVKGIGTAKVRIIGFRHDTKPSGVKAGITFEFANMVGKHAMNKRDTNKGGWERSAMRKWLNSTYLRKFPKTVRKRIASVEKMTNNVGEVTTDSAVTATEDKLWLLSIREVFGQVSVNWAPGVYNAEGVQYQFYKDKGVTEESYYGFTVKEGSRNGGWWLRSPDSSCSAFFDCIDYGEWSDLGASYSIGVSPGFCF